MTADIIKHPDGSWCVIGHLSSGDAHDFFETQAEAIAFATVFYCAKLEVVEPRRTPQTTWAKAKSYGASWDSCSCPDFTVRGGSHRDANGDRVCKHVLHIRNEFRLGNQVVSSWEKAYTEPTAEELFARFA